jgi:hypothetical protein
MLPSNHSLEIKQIQNTKGISFEKQKKPSMFKESSSAPLANSPSPLKLPDKAYKIK